MKKKCELNPHYYCKKKEELITEICRDNTCPWFLKNEIFLNCTWVACNFGPFTLQDIASMMGITRERVRQIEVKALKRLQHITRKEKLRDFWDETDRNFKYRSSPIAGGKNYGHPRNGKGFASANLVFPDGTAGGHPCGGQSEEGGRKR
ncbi:MAG: sigma factor-like helix-turn-helix DNA-binding protein [Syntrophales bacterium]|nr:sigma factor-like helix-turn-helix DNA-binding protein [Syntrophales bacterium]